jgi:ketosteroid isomerase-like protein
MKKQRFFIFIICLLGLFNSNAQQHHQPEKAAIKAILQQQVFAWNQRNIEGFMKYYWNSPDLRFVSKKGITYGWENIKNNYHKNYPTDSSMGSLSFEITAIDILNKTDALVLGSWKIKHDVSEVGGYFTLHFKKIKKVWYIVMDHTS